MNPATHDPPAVTLWGRRAAEALGPVSRGRVLAVFQRALYLETTHTLPDPSGPEQAVPDRVRLACLGEAAIGAGPLNALLDRPLARALPGIRAGDSFASTSGPNGLRIAGLVVRLDRAKVWSPPPWPTASWPPTDDPVVLAAHLNTLSAHWPPLPSEGLAPLVLGTASGIAPQSGLLPPGGVSLAAARPALAALEAWMKTGFHQGRWAHPPAEAQGLLGLGPGLTPSGDDLLGGMLLTLGALAGGGGTMTQAAEGMNIMAPWVLQNAPQATTPISVAHLRAASGDGTGHGGEGAAVVHAAIGALLNPGATGSPRVWRELDALGHTSGWDALAGAWLVLRGWLSPP